MQQQDRARIILLRVLWLSILLGIALEVLSLVLQVAAGEDKSAKPFLVDLLHRLSWSTLVCVGVSIGAVAGKLTPQKMGLAGVLAAPLSFTIARLVQKGLSQALDVAGSGTMGVSVFAIGAIRGVEYGCLGAALGFLAKRPSVGVLWHAAAGLIVGGLFGSGTMWLLAANAKEPATAAIIVSRAINEVLFPVGCALVLYAADVLGKRGRPPT